MTTRILPEVAANGGKKSYFCIDDQFFEVRDHALKRAEKAEAIHTATFSRKDSGFKAATHLRGIGIKFPNKGALDMATPLVKTLPTGTLMPDGKGSGTYLLCFDETYPVETVRDCIAELKTTFEGVATITTQIPWGPQAKACMGKPAPATSPEKIQKALDAAIEKLKAAKEPPETASEENSAPEGSEEVSDLKSELPADAVRVDLCEYPSFYATLPVGRYGLTMEQAFDFVTNGGTPFETKDKDFGPYFTGPMRVAPWVAKTKERMDKAREEDATVPHEGVQRSGGHSLGGSVFKFDLDDIGEADLDLARERLSASGLAARMFTTHSHGAEGKGNRYRVVVLADRQASVDEFKAASAFLGEKLFGRTYDASEHLPYQPAGVWMTQPNRRHLASCERFEGTAVGLDKVLALAGTTGPIKKPEGGSEFLLDGKSAPEMPDDLRQELSRGAKQGVNEPFVIGHNKTAIKSALEYLDPNCEDDWRWALKLYKGTSELSGATQEELEWLWAEVMAWSAQSPMFGDEAQQLKKLQKQRSEHPLVFLKHVQDKGWQNPGKDRTPSNGADPSDWVSDFNAKYTPVLYSTKMAVAFRDFDEGMGRERWTFLPFHVFKDLHCSEYGVCGHAANGRALIKPKGAGWLSHPDRSKNRNFYFNPEQPPALDREGYLNLWMGLNVRGDASQGDPMPMVEHIREVIADGDTELGDYVMGWVALLIQKPWLRHEVALVLRGKKGSGKGTLGNLLCKIFGKHGIAIRHSRHLVGNFNEHLLDCCFLFADEAFFAGDKPGESALKGLITEPTTTIEPKGIGAFTAPNRLSILMATNAEYVVPATADERRYAVLDVSDSRVGDRGYWNSLHGEWMENPDNLAAFVEYALSYDLSTYNPRAFPETKALAEQRAHSLDPWAEWWREGLVRGSFFTSGEWYEWVGSTALHEAFIRYCNDHGINSYGRLSEVQLGLKLKKHKLCELSKSRHITREEEVPAGIGRDGGVSFFAATPDTKNKQKPRCRRLGALEEARAAFVVTFELDADFFEGDEEVPGSRGWRG